ncbi:hypothetical protein ACLB1Q_17075 [Escherichia coli]
MPDGVKLLPAPLMRWSRVLLRLAVRLPASSRFDENDAILVMDNVLIPWKTC